VSRGEKYSSGTSHGEYYKNGNLIEKRREERNNAPMY
jgi:hypothetical protein